MSSLLQIVADFRRRLAVQEQQAMQALEQAHANTVATIMPTLERLYDEMAKAIAAGKTFSLSKLYQANRMQVLKAFIAQEINLFAALAHTMAGRLQEDGIRLGIEAAMQMLQAHIPPGIAWSFGFPNPNAIRQLVGATQAGSPLADLFKGFGREAATRVARALVAGVTLGWNPRRIAPLVQNALNISRNRALVISRQESLRCYKNASVESYRANSDVCEMWRWTCAKNRHSCIACIMMDGKNFPLSKHLESHILCRCAPIPIARSWMDILGPDAGNIPDTRPQIETGESWFTRQGEATQRAILGKGGYELWRNPDNPVTLQDFVKHRHDDDWGDSIAVTPLRELVSR